MWGGERINSKEKYRPPIIELLHNDRTTKSAAFPMLPIFAEIHLKLYKILVEREEKKTSRNPDAYKQKHDEFVVFYTKLMLRYWRYFRCVYIFKQFSKFQIS